MGALGVVYGDIGTSPLYTIQVCFGKKAGVAVEAANVVGVISLIIWALVIIVSIKYLIVILRRLGWRRGNPRTHHAGVF